jgi:cation diffusion facilitator CzcD-associated flavoprotein CzcO
MTAGWLFSASGYYRYDHGFTPELPGLDRYRGRVVHPQHWPEDLDHAGRRVVVVGSGATAMTLVPALAGEAAHVTMLQRSPSYVLPLPSKDALANWLRGKVGEERAYAIARRKNILRQAAVYRLSRRFPNAVRRLIRTVNEQQLRGSGCDVDVHFRPAYDPWDQRLCAVPDGDLFRALRQRRASVVTGHIETFTETGIRLTSGQELEADVVVTATGLELLAFGGLQLVVDGQEVSLPDTVAYRAMMLSGVPNFAYAIGYTNASWTLKVDLVCERLCRLLGHLDATGNDTAVPELADPGMPTRPLLDFKAGYVVRALDRFPRQGEEGPWRAVMSYAEDVKALRHGDVDDGALRFERRRSAAPAAPAAEVAA